MTAPTAIGTFASTGNVTSGAVTPGATIPVGDVVIVTAHGGASVTLTCSDAQGNTWTQAGSVVIASGSVTTTAIFICKVTTAITGAITVGRSATGGLAVTVATLPNTYSATVADVDTATSTTSVASHQAPAVTIPSGGGVAITAASTNTGRTYSATTGTLLTQAASSGSGNPRVGGVAYIDSASAGNVQPVLAPSISNVFGAVSVVVVPTGAGNVDPVANAGADQTVRGGSTVTLNGTGSADSDGTIAAYAWTQTAGTTVTLSSSSVDSPTFTAPAGAGTLTFQLTVTDNLGATNTDTVTITVRDLPTVAIIGDSTTEREGTTAAPPTRESVTRGLLVTAGWDNASIFWWGKGGKTIATTDSGGKTTAQNITDAVTALGGPPDQLVIGLGTNNGAQSATDINAEIDTVIAAIAAAGVPEVLWVDIGVFNGANTQALTQNPRIAAKLAAASGPTVWRYLAWNDYIHSAGVYDSADWIAGTGDTTHMSVQGWAKRDAWIIANLLNEVVHDLAGTAAATSATSATMTVNHALSGSVAAATATTASATVNHSLTGTVAATSATSATMTANHVLAGTVAGTSATSATFTGGSLPLAGTTAAVSGTSAAMTMSHPLAGAVVGVTSTSATMTTQKPLSGVVTATAGTSATFTVNHVLAGVAAAVSGTAGTLSPSPGAGRDITATATLDPRRWSATMPDQRWRASAP